MDLLHNLTTVQLYTGLIVLAITALMTTSLFAEARTGARTLVVKVPVFVGIFAGLYWAAGHIVPMFGF